MYVLFRTNYTHRLIRYLYYLKAADYTDKIGFRYTDVNPFTLYKGGPRGDLLQGSVLLIDKIKDMATLIVKKIYTLIDKWC